MECQLLAFSSGAKSIEGILGDISLGPMGALSGELHRRIARRSRQTVSWLDRRQALPGGRVLKCETFEFLEMLRGQDLQSLRTGSGELQPDDPMVFWVTVSYDESGYVGAIDELDGAVMP